MVLETKRTKIRPYTDADFDDYCSYILEPELQHMLGLNGIHDRESALQNFNWLLHNREFIAIELKEANRVIGHVCLHPAFEALRHNEAYQGKTGKSLSFAIAEPYRRKGIMLEVLSAIISQLQSEQTVDFLDMEYLSENIGSAKLQELLGFISAGTERFDSVELIVSVLPLPVR